MKFSDRGTSRKGSKEKNAGMYKKKGKLLRTQLFKNTDNTDK